MAARASHAAGPITCSHGSSTSRPTALRKNTMTSLRTSVEADLTPAAISANAAAASTANSAPSGRLSVGRPGAGVMGKEKK